eukprot:9940346-Prorocentrum_lima.AAC.1
MTSSLVGSEMCIRDSYLLRDTKGSHAPITPHAFVALWSHTGVTPPMQNTCLLYTSDAADDM